MKEDLRRKVLVLLNKIYKQKIIKNVRLVKIDDLKLIEKGILFDDEHTCYHDYDSIDDIVTGLVVAADNYGIYFDNEYIGLISAFYQYYKDLTRLELSMCIKNEFRNKNIGKYCLSLIVAYYFLNTDIKSIHLSIRDDNAKSINMASSLGFNEYCGYKCNNTFIDIDGNVCKQRQYLLKKKDYIKNK